MLYYLCVDEEQLKKQEVKPINLCCSEGEHILCSCVQDKYKTFKFIDELLDVKIGYYAFKIISDL